MIFPTNKRLTSTAFFTQQGIYWTPSYKRSAIDHMYLLLVRYTTHRSHILNTKLTRRKWAITSPFRPLTMRSSKSWPGFAFARGDGPVFIGRCTGRHPIYVPFLTPTPTQTLYYAGTVQAWQLSIWHMRGFLCSFSKSVGFVLRDAAIVHWNGEFGVRCASLRVLLARVLGHWLAVITSKGIQVTASRV
jgi:hypothetical protein